MNTPPPIPARSKQRFAKWVFIGCGCISAITLAILLVGYLDRAGIIMFRRDSTILHFYPADLKTMHLPQWHATNAIPLTPDQAVLAAAQHLSTKHPDKTWEVNHIELRKEFDGIWTYSISLESQSSGTYEIEFARVLMDGNIWQPTTEDREEE